MYLSVLFVLDILIVQQLKEIINKLFIQLEIDYQCLQAQRYPYVNVFCCSSTAGLIPGQSDGGLQTERYLYSIRHSTGWPHHSCP